MHIIFVDDICIFCDGSRRDLENIPQVITLFKRAVGMQVNEGKYTMSFIKLDP